MDDENTSQNQISEENSIPASPQESFDNTQDLRPTVDVPIPPIDSEPTEVPSGAPESFFWRIINFKLEIINYGKR